MYAVYFVGCTDAFLHAMFMNEAAARKWAEKTCSTGEYTIVFWKNISDIDTSDTGWG